MTEGAKTGGPVPQMLAAFQTATGLGVRVLHVRDETPLWACENAFCQSLRRHNLARHCLAMRAQVQNAVSTAPRIERCAAGLEHVALMIAGSAGLSGWIESGQVFVRPPGREDFNELCRRMPGWRRSDAFSELRSAFFATPVVARSRLEAGTRLLTLLARELETLLDHRSLLRTIADADPVEKAKDYVLNHLAERIRLAEVAVHAGLCPAHLCRLFKRRTGRTLGEYIAQARVERAKRLLAQGGVRSIDAAYAAGFQSVRQFNHVFKAWTNLTPGGFRLAFHRPVPAGLAA